ncbi:type IVB secretion system protein IcmH/DotU [Vibrio nomapromontoriensis]|uniref:type IVB secretion system protein IcmH/DotU n=1 Tax=Vibrio nomapromontoriensis TaxID=2910246 RepID=UPI003D13AF8E
MLEYLDEKTLVWEQTPSQKTTEVDSDKAVKFRSPDPAQSEFLKHFDKSENQLINISGELIGITLKINALPEPDDITELRSQLTHKIGELKERGSQLNYPVAVIDKLCFLFAVVLDEFIIYTDWGDKRSWENKTLLSELFGMRNGGELFFSVTDKAMRQPHKMIDLLEIIYLFLNIGFKGQYHSQGSEQLKSMIYQLEQVMSQYRQANGVHCNTKVPQPKTRRPSRKRHYAITTLLFVTLIGATLFLTHFWYHKTLPQRARDFTYLSDFSQRYILSGQAHDIVFISTDKDLATPPVNASRAEILPIKNSASTDSKLTNSKLANSKPTNTLVPQHPSTAGWLVQMATFSTQKNAEKYIHSLSATKYDPRIDSYKQYFRVVIDVGSKDEANNAKTWLKENQNIDAILVRSSKTVNTKPLHN